MGQIRKGESTVVFAMRKKVKDVIRKLNIADIVYQNFSDPQGDNQPDRVKEIGAFSNGIVHALESQNAVTENSTLYARNTKSKLSYGLMFFRNLIQSHQLCSDNYEKKKKKVKWLLNAMFIHFPPTNCEVSNMQRRVLK